jgi:hypothetical protein
LVLVVIKGCSFLDGLSKQPNLSQKGALLQCMMQATNLRYLHHRP